MFFRSARAGLVVTIRSKGVEEVRVVIQENRKRKGKSLKACPLRVGIEAPDAASIECSQFTLVQPRSVPDGEA